MKKSTHLMKHESKKKKQKTKKQKSKLAMVENNFLEFEKYLKSCN